MPSALPNDILPNYEVLDFIGRGGMGMVYKARQISLDRIVAIKLLPDEIIRNDIDFKQRFKLEAQTMARLSHPGIVAVHDFGETGDGQLFFVMEFIDGQDLARVIEQRGTLPVDEALRILGRVADALVYAHGEGVIHRDIKPANVLIKSNGEVKVADFGLAKIITPGTVGLTATSTSMGSHDFAAPEVFVRGGDADHRADIYSLGVMLYQMLTGVIPRGMFKLPSERVPGLDGRFDEVICKAMEQDREDRFQSVAELTRALEGIQVLPMVTTKGTTTLRETGLSMIPFTRRLNWRRIALAGVAALLVFGGLISLLSRPDTATDVGPTNPSGQGSRVFAGNGHRYQFIAGSFSWVQAEAEAAKLGGHLVTLTSAEENDWVWQQFSPQLSWKGKPPLSERGWWIGGKPLESRTGWQWVTGEPFEYTRWSLEKPPSSGTPCLRQHSDGGGRSAWTPVNRSKTCGYVVEWDSPSSKAPKPSTAWTDVLAKMDVTQHRLSGKWKMVNGQFENVNDAVVRGSLLEFPVSPAGAFDLKVTLMRLPPGAGTVYFPFRFRDHAGVFSMSEYGMPRVGLEMIDGKSRSTNGAHAEHIASYLPLNQMHDVQLCVRDEGIVVLLDDQEIYRWKGDWSRVTQDGTWVPESLGGRKVFAICGGSLSVRLQSIALREVPGDEGRTLPPEPAPNVPRTPPLPAPVIFAKNGHRYQFVPGQFSWTDAEKNAKSMGGHLATLTTQEEHDFTWEQFSPWLASQQSTRIRNRGWWIGASLMPDKQWQWITGEPFDFQRLDKAAPLDARVPRLLQCDNEGGGKLSSWRPMHYSLRFGYLVEWDDAGAKDVPDSDAETRKFIAWLATLPASTEPSHAEHKVPDFMIEGSNRNLRRITDLPSTPFVVTRVRIGPLSIDDTARAHLDILSRQTQLYDLRIYAAESAEVLSCMRNLTRLGTLVIMASPGVCPSLPDDQLSHLKALTNLNSLRLERWSSLTGVGFKDFKDKRKLSSLSLNDCPDISDEGLREIAGLKNLETLSLLGAVKLTDAGLLQLRALKQLKALGLGTGTKFSEQALNELKLALPQCLVNRPGD